MAHTDTNVSTLKINRGNYNTIQNNISSIGANELIIIEDKGIPIPTTSDEGKAITVDDVGEYELNYPARIMSGNFSSMSISGSSTPLGSLEMDHAYHFKMDVGNAWIDFGLVYVPNPGSLGVTRYTATGWFYPYNASAYIVGLVFCLDNNSEVVKVINTGNASSTYSGTLYYKQIY